MAINYEQYFNELEREREAQQNVAIMTGHNTLFQALTLIHVLIFIRTGKC